MTINGFKSYTNSLTPPATVKSNRTDSIVNVSTPQSVAEVAKDLEGAIAHTDAKDNIKLATKIEGDQVTYIEVSRDDALKMLKDMKTQMSTDANLVLAKVSIPESPNHDTLLTVYQGVDPHSKTEPLITDDHHAPVNNGDHPEATDGGSHGAVHEPSKVEQEIMNKLGLLGSVAGPDGKLKGLRDPSGHVQTIAKDLYKALYDDTVPMAEKAKLLAVAVARYNELKKENPQLKGIFDSLKGNPGFDKLVAKCKAMEHSKNPIERTMHKLLGDGMESEIRLGHIGKLMDGHFDGNDPRAILELALDFKGELAQLKDFIPPKAMAAIETVITKMPFLDKKILPLIRVSLEKVGAKSPYLQGIALLTYNLPKAPSPANIASATATIMAQLCKDVANSKMLDAYPHLKKGFEAMEAAFKPLAGALDDVMTAHMDHLQHLLAHPDVSKLGEIVSVTGQISEHAGHKLAPHGHGGGHGDVHEKGKVDGDPHAKTEPPKVTPKPEPKVDPKVEAKPTVVAETVAEVTDPKVLKAKSISEFATKMGLDPKDTALLQDALKNLDGAALQDTLKAIEGSKLIGSKNIMEVVGMFKSDPGKIRTALNALMKFGAEKAKQFLSVLSHAGTSVKKAVLEMGDKALVVLDSILKSVSPAFEKMGIKFEHAVPKLGKFLGPTLAKVLPALGAVASGYDMVRMGKIAATGQWGDTKYTDPDVRALSLLGANLNALDTGLAVAEMFGVGNVGFAANIGLAVAEIATDVAVEYFNENPQKMPTWMRTGIKAASVAMAVAAPTINGPILAVIYKDDLTALANNVVACGKATAAQTAKLLGELGDAGRKKLGELVEAGGKFMKDAYKELESMGEAGKAMINGALDRLSKRPDGIGKLATLYKSGGATAVMVALKNRLAEANSTSSFSNGYAGYRALFSDFKDQVAGLSGEAADAAKKMLYELGQYLDQSLDDWVPDVMYSWAKP